MTRATYTAFIPWLEQRIHEGDLPGKIAHRSMMHHNRQLPETAPDHSKIAAVLLLLYKEGDMLKIVLIERSQNGGHHSGQIAFPGGKVEPEDPSLWHTALRESREEVSLCSNVKWVGGLSPLYVPVSNYLIHPFVGYLDQKPELLAADAEVASILTYDIQTIFAEKTYKEIAINYPNMPSVWAHLYQLPNDLYIWGATAMILAELEHLWWAYLKEC